MSQRYEIREQIGKGGLGAVYKAFDTQLHREVAMKRVLSTEHASEEEVKSAAEKLIAEAKTLSSLNHPNIVTVFDVGQDEKGGFVVMELLKGETLDETVSRGVLTQDDFIEIVYQTMEALIAAQAEDPSLREVGAGFWKERLEIGAHIVTAAVDRGEIDPVEDPAHVLEVMISPLYFRALISCQEIDRAFIDDSVDRAVAMLAFPG